MHAPDWASLFLSLSEKGNPPHPEGDCPTEAQILARLDGAEGRDEARALLLRLVALRITARHPPGTDP